MKSDEKLTIENISEKFDSQFDMVNHAIGLAVNMIHSGRGPRVKIDNDNPASQVLAEIVEGKDYLEEIKPKEEQEQEYKPYMNPEKVKGYSSFKTNTVQHDKKTEE